LKKAVKYRGVGGSASKPPRCFSRFGECVSIVK